MIPGPNYDQAERQARLNNAERLRLNLGAPDVLQKLANWAHKYSLEPEFVRYKVLTDDTFALNFVKDPSRQSLHENLAANHIQEKIPFIERFSKMPTGGNEALYVVRGMVVSGKELHAATSDHGKSIDFKWEFGKAGRRLAVYATHKHTREEGGSQDNQFADVKRFLKEAQACRDSDVLFLAICDGNYYQQPHDGRPSRVVALNEDYPGKRSAACSIHQLSAVYASALTDWMAIYQLVPSADETLALQRMA